MDISLVGFPPESDWILQGPYTDKTLMRNYLAYDISNLMGRYAVRTKFAEVLLNQSGGEITRNDYAGVYVLMEKIKRNPSRVPIAKLTASQNSEPDISGGYILKIDKIDSGDLYFFTDMGTRIVHVYPKADDITIAQQNWIKAYMNGFESSLNGSGFADPVIGYAKYIDVGSFIDFFIINETFKNIDAYRISTFMHKDRNGKLKMGPVWDFDLSTGNAYYNQGFNPEGWIADGLPPGNTDIPFWWARLLEDPAFKEALENRWQTIRQGQLKISNIQLTIDNIAYKLRFAQVRNFNTWPILGVQVWPNPQPVPQTYNEEIAVLNTWIENRINWIDANIGNL